MKEQSEQQNALTLPLARLRWLQEMGVAPALLRPYAPKRTDPGNKNQTKPLATAEQGLGEQQGSGRELFQEMLRSMGTTAATKIEKTSLVSAKDTSATDKTVSVSEKTVSATEKTASAIEKSTASPSSQLEQQQKTFTQWQQSLQDCNACARCEERTTVLTGIGVQDSPDWFVLGGMPTRQDEGSGRIWSASAGRLLAAQLRSVGLNLRQQVYLSYALKCRSNQPQASAESIAACRDVFLQELAWVQPKGLLVLGTEAVQMLWGAEARLDDLRGQPQQWTDPEGRNLPVVVTVDPTALLLRPQQKARAWQDLLVVQQLTAQLN